MMIYLLGMGSSSHPLRPEAWLAWKRTTFEYDGLRYIGSFAPLFVHQYSQAWFDFLWGGPPAMGPIDGTVVPAAPGGSLPFLPEATMRVLKNIRAHYPQAWSRYGFVDAFNPLKKWYDTDIVGIDTGITMIMAENARTAFVWETFMKNPEAQRGMTNAGFKSYNPT
jgi:hypothetical protein